MNILIINKDTGLPIDNQRPPENGDWIREIINEKGLMVEREYITINTTIPIKTITSITVSDKTTNTVINSGNKYYAQVGFTPLVELTLSDLNINIPLVKIPFTKYADDEPTTTELYLTGSIVNGVLTCGGEPVISGNYKVTAARTNRALDRLSGGTASFHVEFDDIDFLV